MKAWNVSVLLMGTVAVLAQPPALPTVPSVPYQPPKSTVLERGAHYDLVETVAPGVDATGQTVLATNRFVRLANGLNRLTEQGIWEPCEALFEQTRDGHIIARHTQHQIILAHDLAVEAAVDFLAPDGQTRLRATPLGVAVLDYASGTSVLVAELQSCQAQLVSPTQVVYSEALAGLSADITYEITLYTFEQNIILREAITPEWLVAQGLDPATSRILVLSEFFDPVEPVVATREVPGVGGAFYQELNFGPVSVGLGKAFGVPGEGDAGPVALSWPTWDVLESRRFLVESVNYLEIKPLLDTLPVPTQAKATRTGRPGKAYRTAALRPGEKSSLVVPARLRAQEVRQAGSQAPRFDRGRLVTPDGALALAQSKVQNRPSKLARPGVVLDYQLITTSITNYVFQSDLTYFVAGATTCSGSNTVFEGGTVLKFTNAANTKLTVNTPVTWGGSMYHPVALLAADDQSVGDTVGTNTLASTNYYATVALELMAPTNTTTYTLQHLRVANAGKALVINGGRGHSLSHLQIVNCRNGVSPTNTDFSLMNALMDQALTNFIGSGATGAVSHLTVDTATWFNYTNTFNSLAVTNSLLVAVSNLGSLTNTNSVAVLASASGVFQTVGAGSHYVSDEAYRIGTTNLNSGLLADIRQMTTYPPLVTSYCYLPGNTTLSPQAQRDSGSPLFVGYHYPPLDFAYKAVAITNASLTLLPGTVLCALPDTTHYALALLNAATLVCAGTPNHPVRVVRHNAVQEQSGSSWATNATGSTVAAAVVTPWTSVSVTPQASFRFTTWPVMAGARCHLRAYATPMTVNFMDNQFFGGILDTALPTLNFTNCLFERTTIYLSDMSGANSPTFYNNLLRYDTLSLDQWESGGTWTFKDNFFDQTAIAYQSADVVNGYNGYVTNFTRLTPTSTNDVVLTSPLAYQAGTLGNYYQPTNSALLNKGSRFSDAAGLYHYTVLTNQALAATNKVTIGFHYVAVDSGTGLPLDYDSNGIPNWQADANGNGTVDSGETNWQDAGDLGLKVLITEPKDNSIVP